MQPAWIMPHTKVHLIRLLRWRCVYRPLDELLFFILILLLSSSCSEFRSSMNLMADPRVDNFPSIDYFIQYIISGRHDHEIKTHTVSLSRRTQM